MWASFSSRPSCRSSTALAKPAIWAVASVPERSPSSCPPPASRGRRFRRSGTDVQSTDALGAADLVGGQADQIHAPAPAGAQGTFRKPCTASQWSSARLPRSFSSRAISATGKTTPRLVVHQHHGHQYRVLPQGLRHLFGGDMPRAVGLEVGDLIPLLLQLAAGLQHGAVLHGGGDDVPPRVAALPCGGPDGPVVRTPCRRR